MRVTHMNNALFHKLLLVIHLLCLSALAGAGQPRLTEAQRQQLVEQAAQLQDCLAKVDQNALQALSDQGEQTQSEVQALCQSGKREAAQQKAMTYIKALEQSGILNEIKKCGTVGEQVVRQMALPATTDTEMASGSHICDGT